MSNFKNYIAIVILNTGKIFIHHNAKRNDSYLFFPMFNKHQAMTTVNRKITMEEYYKTINCKKNIELSFGDNIYAIYIDERLLEKEQYHFLSFLLKGIEGIFKEGNYTSIDYNLN